MNLRDWLNENNVCQIQLAYHIGCTPQHLNRILSGIRNASRNLALKISKFTNNEVSAVDVMFMGEGKERCIKKKEIGKGYVYFCGDGECIKIGSSRFYPDKRITSIMPKYYRKFTLLGFIYISDYLKNEKKIHKILSSFRVAGEWFRIELPDLINLLSESGYNCLMYEQKCS